MQGDQSRFTERCGDTLIGLERSPSLRRLQIPFANLRYLCGGTHLRASIGSFKLEYLRSKG